MRASRRRLPFAHLDHRAPLGSAWSHAPGPLSLSPVLQSPPPPGCSGRPGRARASAWRRGPRPRRGSGPPLPCPWWLTLRRGWRQRGGARGVHDFKRAAAGRGLSGASVRRCCVRALEPREAPIRCQAGPFYIPDCVGRASMLKKLSAMSTAARFADLSSPFASEQTFHVTKGVSGCYWGAAASCSDQALGGLMDGARRRHRPPGAHQNERPTAGMTPAEARHGWLPNNIERVPAYITAGAGIYTGGGMARGGVGARRGTLPAASGCGPQMPCLPRNRAVPISRVCENPR
jgi:hypothetical protein